MLVVNHSIHDGYYNDSDESRILDLNNCCIRVHIAYISMNHTHRIQRHLFSIWSCMMFWRWCGHDWSVVDLQPFFSPWICPYPPGNDHISPPQPALLSRWFAELPKGGICDSSLEATPWKINMETTNHPFRKENDLNQTSRELCSMLIFRGVFQHHFANNPLFMSMAKRRQET